MPSDFQTAYMQELSRLIEDINIKLRGGHPPMSESAVVSVIQKRNAFRAAGDFAGADLIRAELDHRGIVLCDRRTETQWNRKENCNVGGFVKAR